MEEAPSVMTVEQQQAEQMKVYWRVHIILSPSLPSFNEVFPSSLKEC